MERYTLERGGIALGIVSRGLWDGHQGSWPDWGWLAPIEGLGEAGELLVEECRLHDMVLRLEQEDGDLAQAMAQADRMQAEFMRPGVELVSLADGTRLVLTEFHVEGNRVYWR